MLLVLILFFPFYCFADFVAGIGLEGTGYSESEAVDSTDRAYLSHRTLMGVRGEIEADFEYFSLNGFLGYVYGTAKTQCA